MTYGRKESFLGAWSQLGGPWCRLGGPWSRLGGPWSRLGGPWSWLGGPLSRLGGPRSREKISLISEAVRRPREADYEIFKRARATHTSSFKSHKYMSFGVSNETPWNSDSYDTQNTMVLKRNCILLDPPTTMFLNFELI